MILTQRVRNAVGYVSMALGIVLLLAAAHVANEGDLSPSLRGPLSALSAAGGAVLTFGVARRLLTVET